MALKLPYKNTDATFVGKTPEHQSSLVGMPGKIEPILRRVPFEAKLQNETERKQANFNHRS